MSKKSPQLRFEGFTDDWEVRKLGDVVGEIQSGNRLPKDSLTSGNIPYVVAQTKNEGVFKTISKKTLDYNGNPMKLFPGNSISFSIDNPEAMFYRSTEFYTSNIMRVIHADYLSHQQYLFILENMKSFTRGYDWSRKFSGPVVSNLEYLQPNEQEQCKIGSFILAFDNIITLHQRKLDLLKEQKKGYLQKMFPKNGAKVPELRFAGFADDWEERKLGEISKTTIGEFVIKTKQSDESPYPVYNGGRSYTGKYDEYNNDGPKIVISARGANAGFVNYVSGRYWAGNSCYSVSVTKEDEFSIGYLYQFIKYNQVLFTAYQQAANIPSVSKSDVEKFSIKYPTVLEQKKIESFFKQLNNTIALHQRKLDLLKEQKKGFLQKMFV